MATYTAIFVPTGEVDTASLNATTSTAAIVIGNNRLFAITATGVIHIAFGNSGMAAADANDFRLPLGVIATYDLAAQNSQIRIYNPGAGAINYYIQYLSRS